MQKVISIQLLFSLNNIFKMAYFRHFYFNTTSVFIKPGQALQDDAIADNFNTTSVFIKHPAEQADMVSCKISIQLLFSLNLNNKIAELIEVNFNTTSVFIKRKTEVPTDFFTPFQYNFCFH